MTLRIARVGFFAPGGTVLDLNLFSPTTFKGISFPQLVFFAPFPVKLGEVDYGNNCYSGPQLPLMGVTGVQSTLRSISGHYSVTKHVNQGVMK